MNKFLLILFFNLFFFCIYPQEFKIINFDFSAFPEVSAIYEATDETGNIIRNSQITDFLINENNKEYSPSEVRNPEGGLAPVSVVLVLDNSGSMADADRLNIAKRGITIFLKSFPFESSELALESFSDDIIVNTDFTQKPERVSFTLNSISPLTGTNFNNAFLKSTEGAIELMQHAINQKILIFITDGLSSANVKQVTDKAISLGIQVHCIILQLNAPKDLINISKITGGSITESIQDEVKLAHRLTEIIQKSQTYRYGSLKWITDNNCNAYRNLKIRFKNMEVTANYIVPSDKIANIEVNPSVLYFKTPQQGNTMDAQIEVIPHRAFFNVTDLNLTKPNIFSIYDKALKTKTLFPDSIYKLKLKCNLNDNTQLIDYLRISTKECPDKTVKLIAGSEEKLIIVHPAGGEIFVPGMDTCVLWDGISGNRKVEISFRSSPEKEWSKINVGSKLQYNWLVAKDTCNKCQLKLTPFESGLFELKPVRILEYQGSSIKSAMYNSDGTYLVSNDEYGFVVVWNTLTGMKERVYGGFKFEDAAFYDQNNTLVLFNKGKISLLRNSDNLKPASYSFERSSIYTSMSFDNGNEALVSAYLLPDKAGFQRIWMPGTSNVYLVDEKHNAISASFTPSNNYVVTLEAKSDLLSWNTKNKQLVNNYSLPKWFERAIIGNSSTYMAVTGNFNIQMLTIPDFKVLWKRNDINYIKFSQSGNELVASDTSGKYCFIDCLNGSTLFSFHDYTIYQCSPHNRQILLYSNDTLWLYDADKKANMLKFVDPEIRDCRFSPDGKKVLVLNGKNEIDIFDASNGQLSETVSDLNSQANSAFFNPNNQGLAVILANGNIQLFEKVSISKVKDAISNTFSIISPKPQVTDTVNFGDRYINQEHELMVHSFVKNNTRFPVTISAMEIFDDNNKVFTNQFTQFPLFLKGSEKLDCEFKFSPTKTGRQVAYLKTYTLTDTFTTFIEGNGLYNSVNISTLEINFGKVKISSFKDTTTTVLINNGSDTINIQLLANAGPDTLQFNLLNNIDQVRLAPKNPLLCKLRFAPKFRGLTTGYINAFIKGNSAPQRIRLTGEGLAPRMVIVKGTVRNISDSMPLTADLLCNDLLSNKTIITDHTDTTGQFMLNLNSDRNYSIVGSKINFLSSSENIDLSEQNTADTIFTDIWLTEIKRGGIIKFNCIFFDFAKSTLKDISKNDLNRIAKMLSDNKSINIEIHGHTDNIGTDSANMVLSADRAKAVKDYIVKKGISPLRMKTIAFGEKIPVATNNTAEGRKANRRVEFKIVETVSNNVAK